MRATLSPSGSRFGDPHIYTDFQKMLRDAELDAVGVVGPPTLHHEAGLAVLESGRHLFIDKPPAPDLSGTRELQASATEHGVHMMVGFMKRHATAYTRAKELNQLERIRPLNRAPTRLLARALLAA